MVIGSPTVLNLIPGGVMKMVHVNQTDKNMDIQFQIMNGNQPFNVPEGWTGTIRGTKGDAFGYAAAVTVTAGSNLVTAHLKEQLTAVAGVGNVFELVFASTSAKVSTENFILAVEKAALNDETVISESDLVYANQVLNQLQSVAAVNQQVQQNKANIATETATRAAADTTLQNNINTEAAARQAADQTLQSNINAEASTRATADALLQSQIDQLVAPSGEAPSAAEVLNARIGADGVTYPTLGDAIRTNDSELKSQLKLFNAYDYLSEYVPKSSTTSLGVTYTWNGNVCVVSGTSTGISQHNIIADPAGTGNLAKGQKYRIKYSGVDVMLVVYFYTAASYSGTQTRYILYNDGEITVPNDAASMIIRLRVNEGITVNESVSPHVLSTLTNKELEESISDLADTHEADIEELEDTGTITGSGNPLLLKETSNSFFKQLEVSGNSNHIIKCFGKNLARPLDLSVNTLTKNGVTFTFDFAAGSIRVQSAGATADTVSGNYTTTINGVSNSYNYKLHVKDSCYVTVSSNCNKLQPYVGNDGMVTMQVTHLLNGANYSQRIKESNFTLHLAAGEDVGIRFHVRQGWSGDLTFYPQIEIGTHATEFENVKYEWTTGIANSGENAFSLTGATGEKTVNGTITTIIDVENKALSLSVSNLSSNYSIGNLSASGYTYLTHLKYTQDTRIFMSGIPSDGSMKAIVFYIDENDQKEIEYTDFGNGKFGTLLANVDYYYTLTVLAGANLDDFIVKPVIATGMYAIKSNDGITTLICDDAVAITATASKRNTKESAINGNTLSNNYNSIIGMRAGVALKRLKRATKPIITFTDDDTSSVALVTRYYNALHSVGAVGNYAVITNTMLAQEGEKELLLDYEKQGFGCLYHCSAQGGAQESSPAACYLPQFRNMTAAEDNFMTGLRAMHDAGFSAYKYWVSPYGVDDEEILTIPRRHGMECLITMGQFGHISPANCDRWHIPRWHLSPAEYGARGLDSFKQIVDACVADYGWLIVVTHCNEWDATTTMDTALADAAQYAIMAGMDVRNFPDAFELFRPFFYMNELF